MKSTKLIGIVVALVGVAVLAYGIYEFYGIQQSLGKKLIGGMEKIFTGGSKLETRAIALMIAGGAAALVGAAILGMSGKSRKR
jgi:hypothetical protein